MVLLKNVAGFTGLVSVNGALYGLMVAVIRKRKKKNNSLSDLAKLGKGLLRVSASPAPTEWVFSAGGIFFRSY